VSPSGRDFAKGSVVTLVPTGLAFIFSGWLLGVICLFVAGGLSLILWTPLGRWLGFTSSSTAQRASAIGPSVTIAGTGLPFTGPIRGASEFGPAIRQHHETRESEAEFLAVEAEIALAHEEAVELARLLWDEWPHITLKGTDLEEAISDWGNKTTDFIAEVLGSGYRAAFKTAASRSDVLDRLESQGKFLGELAVKIGPEAIRANRDQILKARSQRRENQAATFFEFEHFRAPGAPPP